MISVKHLDSLNFSFLVHAGIKVGYEIIFKKLTRGDRTGYKSQLEFNRETVRHGNNREFLNIGCDVKGISVFIGQRKTDHQHVDYNAITDVAFVLLQCSQRKALESFPDEQKHLDTLLSMTKENYYRLVKVIPEPDGCLNIDDTTFKDGDVTFLDNLLAHNAHKVAQFEWNKSQTFDFKDKK